MFPKLSRWREASSFFLLADDDFCFDHAIAAMPALIDQHGKDPTVAGVTGAYVVETSQGSAIVSYQNVEADDVTMRVTGFLSYSGPNILQYAPIRRDIVQRVFAFMNTLPVYFSFHDQIICLLYLLNGKFVRLTRLSLSLRSRNLGGGRIPRRTRDVALRTGKPASIRSSTRCIGSCAASRAPS